MTTFDVLVKARKLLSDPRRWTKGSSRNVNADGEFCYCASGALYAALGGYDSDVWTYEASEQFEMAAAVLRKQLDGHSIIVFNDNYDTTYEDVMELFSKAAQAALVAEQQVSLA